MSAAVTVVICSMVTLSFCSQAVRPTSLVVTASEQGQILVVKCQTGIFFPPCVIALLWKGCAAWGSMRGFRCLFVAREAVLCRRKARFIRFSLKLNSTLAAGLMCTQSGWISPQPLQVPGKKKQKKKKKTALQAEQRKLSREWKCQMRRRQPLLSPESHLCMHGHSWLLNAKLIVIHSCLKWFGNH